MATQNTAALRWPLAHLRNWIQEGRTGAVKLFGHARNELAEDLRREVRKLIREDKSDTEIKTYLVERYGDFVLYRPPVKPLTWPLWFGPFLMLLLAVWGLWRYLRLRQQAVST